MCRAVIILSAWLFKYFDENTVYFHLYHSLVFLRFLKNDVFSVRSEATAVVLLDVYSYHGYKG